jgi:CP family cyanate transporter-like MFS transporter
MGEGLKRFGNRATKREEVVARGRRVPRGRGLLLFALVLVAANLRLAFASVAPVLETIRQDLGLGSATLSLLTTVPVLCMSGFALVAPRIGEWVGAGRGVLSALVLIGLATALRAAGGTGAIALFAATLLVGLGVAVAQSLVPAVVKRGFPRRAALVTGLYTFSINVGAVLAAGATVPLRDFFGGSWPAALASWALPVMPAAALWWLATGGGGVDDVGADAPGVSGVAGALPWTSGRAWLVALFFGGTSSLYWATLTWLAPLYQDQGFAEQRAGLLLTTFVLAQTAATLAVPALADRSEDRRPWLALCLAAIVAGFTAVALAPLAAPWAWAVVLGAGVGGLVPLALTLPLDNAPDADAAGRLSAMAFFVGYLLAALAPLAVGVLRDATGSFVVPVLALAAIGAVMLTASARFRPPRHDF